MAGNNALKITMQQTQDGAVLSTVTLDYPSLENAAANVLGLDLIDAVATTIDKWSAGKAVMTGEGEIYEAADTLRKGKATAPGQNK